PLGMLAIPSPRRNQTDQTDQSDLDQDGFWNEGRFAKNVNWPPIFQPSCSRLKFVNLRQLKMLALVIPSAIRTTFFRLNRLESRQQKMVNARGFSPRLIHWVVFVVIHSVRRITGLFVLSTK
ncbi:MAG: hypothetical protein EBU88_15895, partial [Acidobacteria bacterium]|nr:hypothetical protein [Acidobacteriota bacterium]